MNRAQPEAPTQWIDIDPCWVFHILNAYDQSDGRIVLDLVRFDRFYDQNRTGPADPHSPALHHFTIDVQRSRVEDECADQRVQEFPRLEDRFFTHRHRFGYTTQLLDAKARSGVLLHDFIVLESAQWLTEL